ncbi:MAG: AAA family ATPase [Bacteroidales bacterium]|nr:AAA family ATPase [Bacteroidales bacterium]
MLFKKGDKIGKYIVNSFIKKGALAESYTVYGSDDVLYFCKVFEISNMNSSQLFEGKEVFEIVFCKELSGEKNDNIIRYVDNGGFRKGDKDYHYLVTEFYYGQLLSESLEKEGVFDVEDALQITLCVLNGLMYMHSKALLHNDITPFNIMLKETDDGMLQPTIIDLGHVSYMVMGRPNFFVGDLAPFFRAPETYRGIYTPKSDVFSVGALLYYLVFGKAPWEIDLAECHNDKDLVKSKVKEARKQPLVLDTEETHVPEFLHEILKKALALKVVSRFSSAEELFNALLERLTPEMAEGADEEHQPEDACEISEEIPEGNMHIMFKKGSGNGFDQVAGRDSLKEQLRKEVIFGLQNPEKAKKYKLLPVNGILLYGPPGCGKSLVTESFAEELGFNYTILKASQFGNIYQPNVIDNLQRIFDAASLKAPFVIAIDEMEYLIPNPGSENVTKESVAMLTLMNGCAQRGILVVATSNQPEQIDPFVMRPGCIDRVFFVSQPDFEARKDIFMKHLKDRPCETIDYAELARLSEDFVAGDITEAVNEAAMTAAYMDVPISQKILVDVLKYKNPTYATQTKIGFK